jgi:hypothetical protein
MPDTETTAGTGNSVNYYKMNKKGTRILSEQLFILFELILIAIIGLALLNYVYGLASSSLYERAWISHDLKMAIEAASSSPNILIHNYAMPEGDELNRNNTNISIIQTSLNISATETKAKKQVVTSLAMVYSPNNQFSSPEPGAKFRIIQNLHQTIIDEISKSATVADYKWLACEQYRQQDTGKEGKKIIFINKNPANEAIVNLLEDAFTYSPMSAFYEIFNETRGNADLSIYITCSPANRITISRPSAENQKFACLLAEKIQELKYDDIWQAQDQNLIHDKPEVHLQFNCDLKRAAAIAAAIDEYFK